MTWLNWGERGKVRVVGSPIVDEKRGILKKLVMQMFDASNADLFFTWANVDQVFDALGLPKVEETLQEVQVTEIADV